MPSLLHYSKFCLEVSPQSVAHHKIWLKTYFGWRLINKGKGKPSNMKPAINLNQGMLSPLARLVAFSWSSEGPENFFPLKWLKPMLPLEGNNFNVKTYGLSNEVSQPYLSYKNQRNPFLFFPVSFLWFLGIPYEQLPPNLW